MKKILNQMLQKTDEVRIIEGDVVDLRLRYETSEETAHDGIPTVYYEIYLHNSDIHVGSIDLRLKMNEMMYYYGHIGYNIFSKYRGNNYSYFACLLVFKEAKERYNLNELYITCNPENIASYKILLKLKGELVEVVQIPHDHELYRMGDRMKCIFRYLIKV